ncbi:MAG: ATP-binding cassette domain-containing protein [Pseudomonadota bacterium]
MTGGEGLRLEALSLALRGEPLFAPVTLTVPPGRVAAIVGPSGCGKSSLLLALCGLLSGPFTVSGEAWIESIPLLQLPPERRKLGLIFQDPLLLPHLSVAENLAFGLSAAAGRRGKGERAAAIEEALAQIRLPGYGKRDPATLSGGQRARVALMRSLLAEPRALLLDEAFASLDAGLRQEMRSFVAAILRERGLPALLVTHDQADAEALAEQQVELAFVQQNT